MQESDRAHAPRNSVRVNDGSFIDKVIFFYLFYMMATMDYILYML
jgi:hypothetical protein